MFEQLFKSSAQTVSLTEEELDYCRSRFVPKKMDQPGFGYAWALEMNSRFKQLITDGDHKTLVRFDQFGREGRLAIPTPEHFLPLLYTLGLRGNGEEVSFFNDKAVAGSLTMTSVKFG